jgi:hypothetical protein
VDLLRTWKKKEVKENEGSIDYGVYSMDLCN